MRPRGGSGVDRRLGVSCWLLALLAIGPRAPAGAQQGSGGTGGAESCLSHDPVSTGSCYKHLLDAELEELLDGNGAHPFGPIVLCGRTIDTPDEIREVLGINGSDLPPCSRFQRNALLATLNIRRSLLEGNGLLGEDGTRCFGVTGWSLNLRCGSFFVPNPATPDPNDAISVNQDTPLRLLIEYGSQLCVLSSCPQSTSATCGQTLKTLAAKLSEANNSADRRCDCGGCRDDRTPPVLTCPTGTLTFECQGPAGAPLDYRATATDDCDGAPEVFCFPPPGTVLPLGDVREVECKARDIAGNWSFCEFLVKVVDTKPPAISCPPGPIVVDCVVGAKNGAFVSYPDPIVVDACDEHPNVICVPRSGSFFTPGLNNVICQATDHSGNTAKCDFQVFVVESTPPTLTCPGDITVDCAGPGGTVVNYPPPMVSTTCTPPPTPSCSPPSGSLFPPGTTLVTCSTTGPGGEPISCSFTVTVVDHDPPVLVCPQDMLFECSSPAGTVVHYTTTATDTCDPEPALVCDPPPGSAFPVGTTTVTCIATDDAGNPAECRFRVTVKDATPPRVVCPQGPVIAACTSLDPVPGAIVNFPAAVALDDCDADAVARCEPPSGSFFPLGVTTVTCRATDDAGNTDACSFEVHVVDQSPPMLVCPGDLHVECTSSGGADVTYPEPQVSDECDIAPEVVCEPPSGSHFPMGMTTVTCRATDDAGNSITCSFKVIVEDTMPPQVVCPPGLTVECTSSSGTRVEYLTGVSDNCDPEPSLECDPPSGTIFPVGQTIVSCVAIDDAGNEAACSFAVSVVDTTPPRIICPDPIVAECQGPAGTPVVFTVNAVDDCSTTLVTECSPASGDLFPPGTTTVTCLARDPSGNESRCDFTVTIIDTAPPRITCPEDAIVLECTGGNAAPAIYPQPTVADDCDAEPTVTCTPPLDTPLLLGRHTVTCVAVDASGNRAECSFEITVVDSARPALNCPQDIVRECQGPDGALVEYSHPTPTDSCDPAPNLVCLPPSGSLFAIGTTTVTCTADDQAGNMVMCTFTVTVVDTMPPLIECPPDITAPCTSAAGAVITFEAIVQDGCDPAPTLVCEPPSGSTFPRGTTTVRCTATDRTGNSASCAFRVTVVDDVPPRITCPDGFEASCMEDGLALVEYPPPQVHDDCDPAPAVVCEPPSGTRLPPGEHVISCRATDDAGNAASCEFTVKVLGGAQPALVCPPPITAECTSPDGAMVDFPLPVATAVCDGQPVVTCVPPPGSLFPMGMSEVVCTARDRSGNEIACSFIVTVVDTTPPLMECPAPMRVQCSSSAGAAVSYDASATDACDGEVDAVCEPPSGSVFPLGTTTVRCTASDEAGNASECSFTVTVEDTSPPGLVCGPDLTVPGNTVGEPFHKPPGWPPGSNPPPNEITAVVTYPTPGSTDACQTGAIQVTCDPPSGTRLGFGMHTVTCTARDHAGNTATCTFQVNVVLGIGDRAFIRSDANQDAALDIGDPIFTLMALFSGGSLPMCMKSADANDDGKLEITDAVYSINYQFLGGPAPPPPTPPLCGLDNTPDALDCFRYRPCE